VADKKIVREVLFNERFATAGPDGDGTEYVYRFEILSDAPRSLRFSAIKMRENKSIIQLNFPGLNVDDCEALSARFAEAAKVLRGV